jgi:rhodanese-related sulfurtransferase
MNIEEMIINGAPIIDVRTPMEFDSAQVVGSKNIPFNEVTMRIEEFKAIGQPFLLCCLSGNRSGQATAFLNAQGIECYNGGAWTQINYIIANSSTIKKAV